MKLIFMGTPDFAVPTLQALLNSEHDVAAVYTQPPRPAGRGHKEQQSPVHQLAEQHGIEVCTPKSLKTPATQEAFTSLNADAAIVAAYGLLLPQAILDGCKYGCINVHPSLLPRWRGAAPLQWTIMAGDTETAMCIMQMDAGLDTGDILLQRNIMLPPDITAQQLHDDMAQLGGTMILETLEQIDSLTPTPQSTKGETYAKRTTKQDGKINWQQQTAHEIDCLIRGLNPWPGTFFTYQGESIKILSAKTIDMSGTAGEILDDQLTIACKEGAILPTRLQRPGKKPMEIKDFLRGFAMDKGNMVG